MTYAWKRLKVAPLKPLATTGKHSRVIAVIARDTNRNKKQTNTKMSTNKNAYEIRLDILQMAEGHLLGEYHEKLNALRDQDCRIYEEYIRERDLATEERRECASCLPTPSCSPEMVESLLPTPEAIAKRAKEIYAFVEGH